MIKFLNFSAMRFVANAALISGLVTGGYSALAQSAPSHDAASLPQDKTITNACIKSGSSKTYCLCITSVLKHQMEMREYTAAAMLYEASKNGAPSALAAAKMSLSRQGYSDDEITATDNHRRELTDSQALPELCEQANEYFKDS